MPTDRAALRALAQRVIAWEETHTQLGVPDEEKAACARAVLAALETPRENLLYQDGTERMPDGAVIVTRAYNAGIDAVLDRMEAAMKGEKK